MTRILFVLCLLLAAPAVAAPALDVPASAEPGALVIGHTSPGATLTVDGRAVRVSSTGEFLLGVGRDDTGEKLIRAVDPDGAAVERRIAIAKRSYRIQRINGLPKKTVTPDPETLKRILREAAEVREVRTHDTDRAYFDRGFVWPVRGIVTGVYGSQRILNGKPRAPHLGVDIAAPEGTPIHAMGAGIVRMADPGMVLNGKIVMIDHGFGLTSVYIHMSRIGVKVGEHVDKGQVIGQLGQTGRATGPNTHWGVSLFSQKLDPMLVVGPMPQG